MSKQIILSRATVNGDHLVIELLEPSGHPAVVRVRWPPQPSLIPPTKFNAVAADLTKLSPRPQSGSPRSGRTANEGRVRAGASMAGPVRLLRREHRCGRPHLGLTAIGAAFLLGWL
jgi:hypothetical protein